MQKNLEIHVPRKLKFLRALGYYTDLSSRKFMFRRLSLLPSTYTVKCRSPGFVGVKAFITIFLRFFPLSIFILGLYFID